MAAPVGPEPDHPPGATAVAAGVIYTLLVAAGWLWLWIRDRTGQIPLRAAGEHGLWTSLAIGATVGLGVSGVSAVLSRYLGPLQKLEQRLAALLGPLSDNEMLWLALFSAVGEEFFFRLAMQDALGLTVTSLLFALAHVGPRQFWLWPLMAGALGTGFGWMVQAGCGLLSVTTAHALINYLSLRRMET